MQLGLGLLLTLACLGPAFAQGDASKDRQPEYAFDLRLAGTDKHTTFAELAESGRPFVLFFWISDCPHCKRQLPFVELMYRNMQQYKMKVDVVTINCDKIEEQALETIKERGIQAPVLWDPDVKATNRDFDMKEKGTPTTFIFKPGGVYVEDFDAFNSSYMVYVLDKMGVDLPKDLAHLKQK
jgi:thiol-disulfide isomerase/thioredoxin